MPDASKVAIVTGGGTGIGRASALALAREGYAVVLADLADPAEALTEIERGGASALRVRVDVSAAEAADSIVDEAMARVGRIDVLVNNAAHYSAIEAMLMMWPARCLRSTGRAARSTCMTPKTLTLNWCSISCGDSSSKFPSKP